MDLWNLMCVEFLDLVRYATLDCNILFMRGGDTPRRVFGTGARFDLSPANSLESQIAYVGPSNLILNLVSGRSVVRHVRETSSETARPISYERKPLPLKMDLKISPRVDATRNTLPRLNLTLRR